jgi:uncharacterized membrane protein
MKCQIAIGVIVYFIVLVVSMYAAFSDAPDEFCTQKIDKVYGAVGPSGFVVTWLRVFSISLICFGAILTLIIIIANCYFDKNQYEIFKKDEHEQRQEKLFNEDEQYRIYKSVYVYDSSGYGFVDSLKVFEQWPVDVITLFIVLSVLAYVVSIISGLVILIGTIPKDCVENRMGDTTCFILMYIIIFLSLCPFLSQLSLVLFYILVSH